MALEFFLPDIGEGLTEATVVRWLASVGATVTLDQPIVELETDKVVVEIPAPRAGVVLVHGGPEGAVIAVGSILVVIGDAGETWSPAAAPAPSRRAHRPEAAPIVGTLEEADAPATVRPPALPLVRRLAAALGVDLAGVTGTGPGGRITRSDVEGAPRGEGEVERRRLSPTRIAIARNLTRSWQEIPHVTTYAAADPSGILAERSRLGGAVQKMPLEALLIAAIVPVLRGHPAFNASLDGDTLVLRKHYDIGFAVDTREGLMVAVVRGADHLAVAALGDEIMRLAGAARERTITAAEMRGATFTVSNIGAVGGGYGTPIIPLGTTAILSVGRAEDRAVVRDGVVVVGKEMPLSLSYDHRVIDGAAGRAFMADVVAAFEGVGR